MLGRIAAILNLPTPTALVDGCRHCRARKKLDFTFTFAFQPIVDVALGKICSHEALVRGPNGESARWILDQVNDENRYQFDQACRAAAIALAVHLNITTRLSINFMPRAIFSPETCILSTFRACEKYGFPIDRIIFEAVENDHLADVSHLAEIMNKYRR